MATTIPRLIFCADGNPKHAQIAYAAGWLYGARLPPKGIADLPLHFADQDWKKPDRAKYMEELARRRPTIATVLDWEKEEQLPEVLSWAEEAAEYVSEAVLIVPKVPGGVSELPRSIGGREIWLAYSVPTSYGGSPLGLWELAGWTIHLLGGSPQRQHECWTYLRGICEVRSMDGNMMKKMAGKCLYWTKKKSKDGHWQTLNREVEVNGPDECLRRSAENISKAWQEWRA